MDDWRLKTIEALVKPTTATVSRDTSVREMFETLPKRPIERVYVIDESEIVAWVNPRQLLEQMGSEKLDGALQIGAIAKPITFTLTPEMPLTTALEGFLREQATVLPVTPGQWRNTLLGEVSRRDLLLALQDRLTYPK